MLKNIIINDNPINASRIFIYEDAQCVVFEEKVNYDTPMHFSVVPKKPISIAEGNANDEKLLGHLMLVAKKIAILKGFSGSGYNVKIIEDPNSARLLSLYITNRDLQSVTWPIVPNCRL